MCYGRLEISFLPREANIAGRRKIILTLRQISVASEANFVNNGSIFLAQCQHSEFVSMLDFFCWTKALALEANLSSTRNIFLLGGSSWKTRWYKKECKLKGI